MREILITFLMTVLALNCYSQSRIRSAVGQQDILINGTLYSVDRLDTKIHTHYPNFDTLVFKSDVTGAGSPILCNFKPDTSYIVSWACCGGLDIIPLSKLKNDSIELWDYDTDFQRVQNHLMNKPFISIRTKNTTKDSVYAWHVDPACATEHRVINPELWRLGVPPKCYYWSNITTILFFKQDDEMPQHGKTEMEEFLGMENIVKLAEISFRLFDDERFIVEFDEKNNSATLQYE